MENLTIGFSKRIKRSNKSLFGDWIILKNETIKLESLYQQKLNELEVLKKAS